MSHDLNTSLYLQEKCYTSVGELTKGLGWTEIRAKSILVRSEYNVGGGGNYCKVTAKTMVEGDVLHDGVPGCSGFVEYTISLMDAMLCVCML